MAVLSVANYTNHIFQAVSIRLAKDETLPKAVITVSGSDYFVNPLALFNDETRIGYYQGYTVIDEDKIECLCAENRGLLETNDGISVHNFYDTVESAEEALEMLINEQYEFREKHIIPIPPNGYELYHESYGTSVTLGGEEKKAFVIENCKIQWGEWFERSDSKGCCGRSWEDWEKRRNGYLYPINETKMAIAIIFVDDDLNNISQLEPYEYIMLWSPSKMAWIYPSRKYREVLKKAYL